MVGSIQNGFPQQFPINKGLNGNVSDNTKQPNQDKKNLVENINNFDNVSQTQNTETRNTGALKSGSEILSVTTNKDASSFFTSSDARGNNLDISV